MTKDNTMTKDQIATATEDALPSCLDPVWVLVFADRAWGKAETLRQALKNAADANSGRAVRKYVVYLVHKDTYVDSMGRLSYPLPWHPREIHRVPKDLK